MITMRRYYADPPIVSTPLDDVWAVIVPKARTNEITNPSFETATTGYTAGGGSLARSTAQQYHGAYSGAYTTNAAITDGFYYTFTSTVALRAVSCKFLGPKGLPFSFVYSTTAPADLVRLDFVATGRWQWLYIYVNETSATTRRIYWRKNGSASVSTFYVDGVQSEVLADASESVSTYIDGDQQGLVANQSPPAYFWTGTPHASTSTRSGLTRAGGEVKFFRDYGFTLIAMVGLGLAGVQNVTTEYARIDGGLDDYTRKPSRQFTLTGRFDGRSYDELLDGRGSLASLFDRDLVGLDQRLTLLHYREDLCGNVASNTSRITCKYQDGLGGNVSSQVAEQANLTFINYLPAVLADGEDGATLSVQTSVANANDIIKRDPNGVYTALGTGAAAGSTAINDIAIAGDGKVYATGLAQNIGGVAAADGVAYWDGTAWNAMTTGLGGGGAVGGWAIAIDTSNNVYVGGTMSDCGGIGNTQRLGKWNGSAWSSITPGGVPNGSVLALAFDSLGNLYAAGSFTTINGVAANRIAKMTPAGVWSALGGGLDNTGVALAISQDNNTIYAGGTFTVTGTRVAKYTVSTGAWAQLGSGLDNLVNKLALAPNGMLYAAGSFANSGSVPMAAAAVFNGVQWQPLGSGLTGGGAIATSVVVLPTGTVVYGGSFTTAGGVVLSDGVAFWNGGAWTLPDVDLPGTSNVNALAIANDGSLYIGFETNGSAIATGTTTVTNTGTARSYPTITINGPSAGTSRLWTLRNITTQRAIYFGGTIQTGDTWTLRLQPDNLSFTSAIFGNVMSTILPGSATAEMFLQPGSNIIAFYAADSTVTATINWRTAYASLDKAAVAP